MIGDEGSDQTYMHDSKPNLINLYEAYKIDKSINIVYVMKSCKTLRLFTCMFELCTLFLSKSQKLLFANH